MRIPPICIFVSSGLLFAVAFVVSFLYWCFLPAFVLFLYGIKTETSARKLFLYGFIVGSLHYGGSFFWVWSTFPVQWMAGSPYALQLCAIGFYWVLTSSAMGLSGGLFALAVKRLLTRAYLLFVFVPFIWVLSEVFRSFLFSVYSFGPGSFFSVGFSYGYIGYLLAEEPHLAQLSAIAGVYGLSYGAALLSVFAYYCVVRNRHTFKISAIGILIVLLLLLIFSSFPVRIHRGEQKGLNVITVETNFDHAFMEGDPGEKIKKEEVKKAVGDALKREPDAIIMPEDVRLSESFASPDEIFAWAHEATDKREMVILDNGPAVDARGERVLRSYMYDLRTDAVYFFDKRYLVPQGEFMSYLHQGILSLIVSEATMEKILHEARFRPGIMNDSSVYPEYLPGILFCFETMVPYGVKRAEHWRNPDYIAHPISHAWFTNPFSLEYQLDSMLKVSAIWNNVPVVSAGSMTESKLFLPSGEIDNGMTVAEGLRWKLREFHF